MKPLYRNLFYGLILGATIAGIVYAFIYVGKNRSSQISSLKSAAKKQYLSGDFEKAAQTNRELIDSFKVDDEAVKINFANAGFLSAAPDSAAGSSSFEGIKSDSSNLKNIGAPYHLKDAAHQQYLALTKANSKTIASMANNQLGISALKTGNKFIDEVADSPDKMDSLLRNAVILFQEALRKNPDNDSARYNYELLKEKLSFPLKVYAQAEALVNQRRYREAYQLMQKAMQRDTRMKKYEDFTKKVYAVYQIDSLKRS
ncbi:MAG: hypothetical protein DI538_15470 [Azospira oryzae]|jgi:hypothetical protein|nr:MAG: hypothetical protein DI538_15470 [Azospira oryzae]